MAQLIVFVSFSLPLLFVVVVAATSLQHGGIIV